ncbi:putative reverse transcriptase domain-containing protein, partial [Tanacetum coccineum]
IGVETYDASIKDNFNLRVVVLRTINDYHALGTLCGCPYSGFKEKNVAESLVGTLLNVSGKTKDGVNARLDMDELGVKPELFAMQEEDKTTLPPAGYTLTNAEKDIFCETLYNTGTTSYVSNTLVWSASKDSKEIILQELDKMQAELVVTLCLLEKFFPPSFFDIMVHLPCTLTRRNRPEGCIAEETIAEETIEFFSEYHKSMKTIGIPPDKHKTDENEEGKQFSAGKSSEVSAELFQKAHLLCLHNYR